MKKILVDYDKPREIKFDFNALCDFEKFSGVSFSNLDVKGLGLFEMRVLLWAGLKHQDAKLSIADAGNIIYTVITADNSTSTLETIGTDLSNALQECGLFADKANKGETDPKN